MDHRRGLLRLHRARVPWRRVEFLGRAAYVISGRFRTRWPRRYVSRLVAMAHARVEDAKVLDGDPSDASSQCVRR